MTAIKAKNGKTIKQNVVDLLKAFPEARNNDRELFALYWALVDEVDFSGDFDSFLETFRRATPSASIQRARQIINYEDYHENLLPTDEGILKHRLKKAELMRNKHERMKLLGGA